MFDLPQAKRVRREDLGSPASSRGSTPDTTALDLLRACALDFEITENIPDTTLQTVEESEEDGAEFNLFARSRKTDKTTAGPTKIRIRSPTPASNDGGFTRPGRPHAYYFTDTAHDEVRAQFEASAITGEQIMQLARKIQPGMTYKWKVQIGQAVGAPIVQIRADTKRTRLGKKSRIKRRQAVAVKVEKNKVAEEARLIKEREEREKRARRNREKKFKKRARDKLKKQAQDGETHSVVSKDVQDED